MELQMRIILLFVVIISSDAEEEKNLTGIEGGSVTLPDPVVEEGNLIFGKKLIGLVRERKFEIYEKTYQDKLVWNSNTGLFTITGLQRSDSGIYHVNFQNGSSFTTSYKLTVYGSVSTPAVNTLNVSTESCTLQCSVEKAEETTLLWYQDEEIVNQGSSALSLPLTVHKQDFNASYRCVAKTPAEEKTLPVNATMFCSGQKNTKQDDSTRHHMVGIVISIVFVVIILLVALILRRKYFDQNKRTTRDTQDSVLTEPDVQYTDIMLEDRRSQEGHLPDSSGAADPSNLSTVYDKLELHRIAQT